MRVYGSETEYGLYVIGNNGREATYSSIDTNADPNELKNREFGSYLKAKSKEALGRLGVHCAQNPDFISNGGRLYYDMDSTLEYATPESASAEDSVLYELAGERLVYDLLQEFKTQGLIQEFQVNKRSSDHARNNWGSHENISSTVANIYTSSLAVDFLASHYLTRCVYTGAGGYVQNSRGEMRYVISPRLYATKRLDHSQRNCEQKPLVCTAIDKDTHSVRYQQANSEASNSPWAIKIKHASNSLVYRLLEEDLVPEHLIIDRPVDQAPNVTTHINLDVNVATYEGVSVTKIRPVQWQLALAEYCQSISEKIDFSADERWAIDQIIEVCDALQYNPDTAKNRVEWLMRQHYIERRDSKMQNGQPIGRESLKLDFLWDALGIGIAPRLRRRGWGWQGFASIPNEKDITVASRKAPPNTRAVLRARHIRQFPHLLVNWSTLNVSEKESISVAPHQTSYENITA